MTAVATWSSETGATACELQFDTDRWQADLDRSAGGGAHPSPHEILDSALAACTVLTLELYLQRKQWPVRQVRVEVQHVQDGAVYRLRRQVTVDGDLSEEQRASLLRIAQACPVHKTLTGEIAIDTQVA
jgi:putative redox protein